MILALSAMIFFCSVRSVLSGYTVIQKYRFTILIPKLLENQYRKHNEESMKRTRKSKKESATALTALVSEETVPVHFFQR